MKSEYWKIALFSVVVVISIVVAGVGSYNDGKQVGFDEGQTSARQTLVAPIRAQAVELYIENPSFEQGFYCYQDNCMRTVGIGWFPACVEADSDRECAYPCGCPEYQPEGQSKYVSDGVWSQRWFTTDKRHLACICQLKTGVVENHQYELSFDAYAISEPVGELGIYPAINPWGKWIQDPFYRAVVPGKENVAPEGGNLYKEFTRLSVVATAYTDEILICACSNNKWSTRNNTVYVDNFKLLDLGESIVGPTPTPAPTYTPYPTYTPQATCVPGPTAVPGECPSLEEIEALIADRPPVRWPR